MAGFLYSAVSFSRIFTYLLGALTHGYFATNHHSSSVAQQKLWSVDRLAIVFVLLIRVQLQLQ
jgi:hypothetical protein